MEIAVTTAAEIAEAIPAKFKDARGFAHSILAKRGQLTVKIEDVPEFAMSAITFKAGIIVGLQYAEPDLWYGDSMYLSWSDATTGRVHLLTATKHGLSDSKTLRSYRDIRIAVSCLTDGPEARARAAEENARLIAYLEGSTA